MKKDERPVCVSIASINVLYHASACATGCFISIISFNYHAPFGSFLLSVIHLLFLSPILPCETTGQVSLTVIGMGQYRTPPVVLGIIRVSEININLVGAPAAAAAGSCSRLHTPSERRRERKDG